MDASHSGQANTRRNGPPASTRRRGDVATARQAAGIVGVGSGGGIAAGLLGAMVHPLAPLGLIAALPVAIAAILHPSAGLLLTVAAIPLEGLGRFTSGTSAIIVSVAKLFGLVTVCGFAGAVLFGLRGVRMPREMVPLALFWLVGAFTQLHTSDPTNGFARTASFFFTFVFVFCIVNLVDSVRFLRWVLFALLATTAAIGIFSIAIYFNPAFTIEVTEDTANDSVGTQADHSETTTLGEEVLRSGGAAGSPHVYAANLLVAIPLYLYLIRSSASTVWLRLAGLAGLGIACANLLLTHTRAAIVTCIPLLLLMLARGLVRVSVPAVLAGILGALVLMLLLPESVTERLFATERYSVDGAATLNTRLDYWRAGLEMLETNWLFGMGLGNFTDLGRYDPTTVEGHAFLHNIYLQLFNEVGIFGFGAIMTFLAMTFFSFETSWRRFRADGRHDWALLTVALECSFLSGVILGFTMDYLHFAVKDWWFVATAAVILRLEAAAGPPAPAVR